MIPKGERKTVSPSHYSEDKYMELNYTALREARLSAILRGDMRLSAGLMNRLKWKNALLVNGVPRHTDYPVKPGDTVTAVLDEPGGICACPPA